MRFQSAAGTIEFTRATEENQLKHIRKVKEHSIDINLR